MITVIAGTNRPESFTLQVASVYMQILNGLNVDAKLLDLATVNIWQRAAEFLDMEEAFLKPASRFIFVIPEYNGSYPGILKLLIDNSEVLYSWRHKKALLTGVSTGRAGNLRGMEHFTGSLMHMQMYVHPNRLPISSVHTLFNADGDLNTNTINAVKVQVEEFLKF